MRFIVVAGMHRSGTSALSRVLNLIGVSLGDPRDLMPPQPDNPRGFWEDLEISRLNERILRAFGGSWDNPPDVPDGWAANDSPWADEAERMLRRLGQDGAEVHAAKDPRFSLTLPVWLQVVPDARVVLPLRDPLAVCQSLRARNRISLERGARLWLEYHRRLAAAAPAPLVVEYADLLVDPQATARHLSERLGLGRPTDETLAAIEESIAPDLNHENREERDAIPPELHAAREVFATIRAGGLSEIWRVEGPGGHEEKTWSYTR